MYRGVEELSGQGEVSSSLIRGGDRPSRGSKRKSSAEAPTKASAKQSNIASAETSNTTRAASAGSKAVGVGNIAAVPEVAEGDIPKYLIAKLAERDMNAGAATGHVAPFTDTVGITTRVLTTSLMRFLFNFNYEPLLLNYMWTRICGDAVGREPDRVYRKRSEKDRKQD